MLAKVQEPARAAIESSATSRVEVQTERTVFEIVAGSRARKDKWFPGLARILSKDGRKQPAVVQHLTGEKERTCYDWCAGAVDPPSRLLIKLLHSNVGWLVLDHIMRGCKESWWLDLKRYLSVGRAVDAAQQEFQFGSGGAERSPEAGAPAIWG